MKGGEKMIIDWNNVDNKVVWDFVIERGLGDLKEGERMEVYYHTKNKELFASICSADWLHLGFDNPEEFVFIYSFENLEHYWVKKKEEITIDEDLLKQLEEDNNVWKDYVLKLYFEDWMQVKLPKL